jgi:hypothetical protein
MEILDPTKCQIREKRENERGTGYACDHCDELTCESVHQILGVGRSAATEQICNDALTLLHDQCGLHDVDPEKPEDFCVRYQNAAIRAAGKVTRVISSNSLTRPSGD